MCDYRSLHYIPNNGVDSLLGGDIARQPGKETRALDNLILAVESRCIGNCGIQQPEEEDHLEAIMAVFAS